MTDAEKKLLQAQHRLEEAQARNRVKERKARTRRLIQKGAILEKVLPEVGGLREAGGLLLFSPVRAHLLTTQKGRWYCLRQPCALRGGCGSCGSLMSNATSHLCCCHWPRSRLYVLLHHQNCCFRFGNNPPPARIKLPPAALFAVMGIACRNTHFLFAKKKQKQGRKDGENEWRFTT